MTELTKSIIIGMFSKISYWLSTLKSLEDAKLSELEIYEKYFIEDKFTHIVDGVKYIVDSAENKAYLEFDNGVILSWGDENEVTLNNDKSAESDLSFFIELERIVNKEIIKLKGLVEQEEIKVE